MIDNFLLFVILTIPFAFSAASTPTLKFIRSQIYHVLDSYLAHAFPLNELAPLTCGPVSPPTLGMGSPESGCLTLIDGLDTLYVIGDFDRFVELGELLLESCYRDSDSWNVSVSVFELNIRVVGGLLTSIFALNRTLQLWDSDSSANSYSGDIERLKKLEQGLRKFLIRFADGLLTAFDPQYDLPFGATNLAFGHAESESLVTSTAGCGTFLVEFGMLSQLTGDDKYVRAARRASLGLFRHRYDSTGLIGNHINIKTGKWTHLDFGVGAGIDSYFEYLWKAYALFGNDEYLKMFLYYQDKIKQDVHVPPWYIEVIANSKRPAWVVYNSLQGFWPGLQAQAGEIVAGRDTLDAFFAVWRVFGATPEGFSMVSRVALAKQLGYPLRPEIAESIYFLYRATHDSSLLQMGRDMIRGLVISNRVFCGYANIKDVRALNERASSSSKKALSNKMESFFLSETLKYLYLLFDEENSVNAEKHVFNTEAHPIPISAIENWGRIALDEGDVWWEELGGRGLTMQERSCPFKNFDFLSRLRIS